MGRYDYRSFTEARRDARLNALREAELEGIDALISRLEDWRSRLKRERNADFEELQAMNAIIALVDDGDAAARRDVILDENRWDENGNPIAYDGFGNPIAHDCTGSRAGIFHRRRA